MNELILFGATFGVVFMLGFQSLNVNGGHYVLAFLSSFLIGSFNLALYKLAPEAQTVTEVAAFLTGGPLGIIAAMLVHRRWVQPFMRRKNGQRTSEGPRGD